MQKRTTRRDIRFIALILIALTMLNLLTPWKVQAANTNRYLVLVQNRDNTWTAYDNLIEKSIQGKLMIKAAPIAAVLRFSYIVNDDTHFTIQRGAYRYNTYTYGTTKYRFQHSSSSYLTKKATQAPYYSLDSSYNLCHFYSLSNLINCQYYPGSKVQDYKNQGYTSIICYSIYGTINKAPELSEVITPQGTPYFTDVNLQADLIDETDMTDIINETDPITNADATNYPTNKLIMVGDSRTNYMSKWVMPNVQTEFISKGGKGYQWFEQEAIAQVNQIKKPGDVILIWLGVNDYFSTTLSNDTVLTYASKINSLAANEWSDCKVFVAEVGYVDINRMLNYYGKLTRANVTSLASGNSLNGIMEFNDYLSFFLTDNIQWVYTNHIIGIYPSDGEITPEELWLVRDNGKTDGLHYSQQKSTELYQYFVKAIMNY